MNGTDLIVVSKYELQLIIAEAILLSKNMEKKSEEFENERPLLVIEKVQEITGLPKATIYRLVSQGKLQARKLGKRLLFTPEDIDTLKEKEVSHA